MKLLWTMIFCLFAGMASAHSKLVVSTPADGAVLQTVPTELSLTFSGKIRLTKVMLNDDVEVSLAGTSGFAKSYVLPLEGLTASMYEVEWRGLGKDGHVLKGYFFFEVK